MATVSEQIQEIYIGLLGRAADKSGLDYWTAEINAGTLTIEQLRANIVNEQPEYAAGLGSMTRAQTVNELYNRLFERAAETDGLEYWVNGAGASVNVDQLVLALSAGASAADKLVLDNKTDAAEYYTANITTYTADSAKAAVDSVDGTSASVDTSKASTDGNSQTAGQTFTLTTNIDNVAGTSSNDTIIGDNNTTSAADQVDGGAGTDTIKLFGTTTAPSMTNVEAIEFNAVDTDANTASQSDVTSVTVKDSTFTADRALTLSATQSLTLNNHTSAGASDTNISIAASTLNLTLDKTGSTAADADLDLTGSATDVTTVAITTANNGSNINLVDDDDKLTTVTVTGDQALTLDADTNGSQKLDNVDASANTGAVKVTVQDDTADNITVKTGSADDTITFGAEFTKGDTVDAGTGTDTLAVTQASVTAVEGLSSADKATLNGTVSNVEVLKVTDALTSNIDASRFDSINSVVLAGGLNNGGTSTLSNVTTGVSVEIQDAAGTATDILAVAITDASKAGNNSDTVNLVLNDAANAATDLGVVSLVGVDVLNIEAKDTSTGTANVYTLDIANNSTALDTVNITGSADVALGAVALADTIETIDASTATGAVTVAVATGGTSGVVIKGASGAGINTLTGGDGGDVITSTGTGADVLTGNAGNDTITSAAGADTLTGNAGTDTLTGGAGADIFNFDTTEAQIIGTANSDTITDFVVGTDKLQFGDDAGDVFTGITATAAVLGTAVTDTDSVANLADVLTQIGTQTAVTAGSNLGATVYTFTTGAAAGTYLHINDDATAAADAADILINITGIDTALTAGDFSFV